jgi:hypothetical protein
MNLNIIIRRCLVFAVPAVTLFFTWFYLSHTHQELVNWYKGINAGFYKAETWETEFFTETVKLKGDTWCKMAIGISLFWLCVAWMLPSFKLPAFRYDRKTMFEYVVIMALGLLFSAISNWHTLYAFDEVFSAVNFASLPTFQSWSYYILPNNHLFFNMFNHNLFSWSDDLVAGGRIISMTSYILVLLLSWNFLKKWIDQPWMRWIVLISLALQFPVWGFSGQARGYELVLLFSCLSMVCFWGYWMEGKKHLLLPHVVAIVLGMFTLASFLYWMTGLMLASLLMMAGRKKIDWIYVLYMACGMCILFLCYLPFLGFSGLASMTDNQYMKATAATSLEFIPKLFSDGNYYRHLFAEWFCFDLLARFPGYILLLLPLVSLAVKWNNKPYRDLMKLYVSMLLAFLLVCIVMKNMPFNRNMIAHGYFVWLVLLLVLSTVFKNEKIRKGFFALMLVATVFSTRENYHFMDYGLYYYNVNDKYKSLDSCAFNMEPSSTVYLDNESFYWWYVLRKKFPEHKLQVISNRAAFKRQDYAIWMETDSSFIDTSGYKMLSDCSEFRIYKREK